MLALALVVVISALVTACGSGTTSSSNTPAEPNTVIIKRFSFTPGTLTVAAGATVKWNNKEGDATPHSIKFSDASIPTSPDLTATPSTSTYSHTFTTAGTFAYICGIHNYMKGTIKVTP